MILAETGQSSCERASGNVVNKAILQYLDSMDAAFNGDNIHKRRSRQSHARL